MRLELIMPDICEDKEYRFHLAKTAPSGKRPLDALAKSDDEWLRWQLYRGTAKERFTKDLIVTFAQISGERFLFGGIFEIKSRESKQYRVELIDRYSELIGRLVLKVHGENKRATVFKPSYVCSNSVIAGMYEHKFKGEPFSSFEKINHSFSAIELIVKNDLNDWRAALSSVNGIYLLSDEKTGKHYVGSAYGSEGIWGRWKSYVHNYHGNNEELVVLFTDKSATYFEKYFKFSILEILPFTSPKEEVIAKEVLWKRKLFSREYGYNGN
ncbi:MAG: excinuclease ABC subunit C [Gammaproteobacteria bacterium RIFCSPLOWO2_02_FULL_57_10]|nr:MAG: excinuclease ABC subunit C [Gammaproteobacteria bacterium RIFCSPLOWO2_02_FULL_57_10]